MSVVLDGRLDDADELRELLGTAREAPDSELISAGYLRWGVELIARLRGEFALLIWDAPGSRLLAARDPFGVRPLYYARPGNRFLIATDPAQILATRGFPPEPDDYSVVGYLLWQFHDPARSFFREIQRLPPGHLLAVTKDGIRIEDYRRPVIAVGDHRDARDHFAEYQSCFLASIRKRIASNAPVVLQLSGGLDSSSIVGAADRLIAEAPKDFPAVRAAAALHPGLACDEEPFIRAVAGHVRLPVETWDGTAALAHELDGVPISTPGGKFSLTGGTQGDIDLAHRLGARVVVSGVGGDQLGAPYGALEDAVLERRWPDVRRFILGAPASNTRTRARTLLRLSKSLAPPALGRLHDALRFRPDQKPAWLTETAWRNWRTGPVRLPAPSSLHTRVQRARWADLTNVRHTIGMEYFQRHGARNGVEVRFPFSDWNLVMCALSIPSRYWPPPWPQERLHRAALAGFVPPAVEQRRNKADFSEALANRVRRQLGAIQGLLGSGTWMSERYVDLAAARAAVDDFARAARPSFASTWAVWGTATVEAWLRGVSGYTTGP